MKLLPLFGRQPRHRHGESVPRSARHEGAGQRLRPVAPPKRLPQGHGGPTGVSQDAPEDLRPGLSAEVRIGVQRLDRALQVPCQAVFRHGEKSYCLRVRGSRIQPCELSLGPTNGTTVVVRGGLEEGQEVILAAAAHRDEVALPELPAEHSTPGPLAQASLTTRAGLP